MALAANLEISPSVSLREIYSDNIGLTEDDEQEDYVTELAPSLVVIADGNRLDLEIDYQMQNLFYIEDDNRDNTNHRLNGGLDAELLDDRFFVESTFSISQQLRDSRFAASNDAISGAGNLDDVYSYGVSPRWQQRFGSVSELSVTYTYDIVRGDNENIESDSNGVVLQLYNGTGTGPFYWNADYRGQKVDYEDDDKSDTELVNATLGLQLSRRFSIELLGLYENNEFVGQRGNVTPDDTYYGVGFSWSPVSRFNISLAYNERKDPRIGEDEHFGSGSISWSPSQRTDFSLEYGNRFFGETVDAEFTHRTRRTSMVASYREGISDFRGQALDDGGLGSLICPIGFTSFFECRGFDENRPPEVGEEIIGVDGLLPSITESTFALESMRLSLSLFGNRNTLTLSATQQAREFIADGEQEEDFNTSVTWSYRIGPRFTSEFSVRYLDREFDDGSDNQTVYLNWLLSRKLGAGSEISLAFGHDDRDDSVRSGGRSFTESRVTLSFQKTF